jgi:hypothetical protein
MKKIALYISLIVFASACTVPFDVELNDQDNERLVVEGWVTNQPGKQFVRLTKTTSYFYNQPAPVASGALVAITDGENIWELQETSSGYYEPVPDFVGEFEKTYTLSIDYNGEQYQASSYLRPVSPIDSLGFEYIDPLEEYGLDETPWYDIRIWTQELPGLGDHYMWKTYVNGVALRDTLSEISFVDDGIYDGNYVAGVGIDYVDTPSEAVPGDTIHLEQWNIGVEAYDIFIGILNETDWNGGLFDAPPANVETNINNGALGYFGAAGISTGTAVIP